ncbi:ACP synthase, partial [Staphylococcus chromogenes]
MIPTLEDVIIYSDDFIDIINYDTSYLVYEDVLLIKSLNDLNKYQMVDRVLFMQKYCKGDFDYLLDDAEFRYINKNYNNLNLFTFINSVNNNFSLKPFLNEEQLKSILAIKKEDAAWSYNSSITS